MIVPLVIQSQHPLRFGDGTYGLVGIANGHIPSSEGGIKKGAGGFATIGVREAFVRKEQHLGISQSDVVTTCSFPVTGPADGSFQWRHDEILGIQSPLFHETMQRRNFRGGIRLNPVIFPVQEIGILASPGRCHDGLLRKDPLHQMDRVLVTSDHISYLQGTTARHAERRTTKHGRHGRHFQRRIVTKRRHENVLLDTSEGGEGRGIRVLEQADAGGFEARGAGG